MGRWKGWVFCALAKRHAPVSKLTQWLEKRMMVELLEK